MQNCWKDGTYKGGGMYENWAMWSSYHKSIAFSFMSVGLWEDGREQSLVPFDLALFKDSENKKNSINLINRTQYA